MMCVEHLDHKPAVIARLKKYLKPGGKLLIRFPPYYSAYGGHQQHLRTWFRPGFRTFTWSHSQGHSSSPAWLARLLISLQRFRNSGG